MPVTPTIDRDNKLPNAQDYGFLSREAISLIQSLSGDIWTDFNTHDPGITLLEAICYALTDLGYRTAFDIQDIISPEKPSAKAFEKIFYTARQILPCNPLTLMDYRKLLIDTEGVRNAWIEKSDDNEIIMYVQKAGSDGSSKQRYSLTYDSKQGGEVLRLRGLYKVFVDYEEYILKDNREDEIAEVLRRKLQFHRNLCEDFVSVTSIEYEKFPIEAIIQVSEGTDIDLINASIYKVIHDFFSPPITFYSLEQMLEKHDSAEDVFEGPALKYGFIDTRELERSERFKDIHLSDIIRLISEIPGVIAVKKFTFGRTASVYSEFTEWINGVTDVQKTPRLDIENSEISFVRSGDRHRPDNQRQADKERVTALFSFLQSADFRSRLKGTAKDIPVPAGEFMNISDYFPFQNNLPASYGMQERFVDDTVDQQALTRAVTEWLDRKAGTRLRRIFSGLLEESHDNPVVIDSLHELFADEEPDDAAVKNVINRLLHDKPTHTLLNQITHEVLEGQDGKKSLKDRLYNLVESKPRSVELSEKTRVLALLARKSGKNSLLTVSHQDDISTLKDAYLRFQVQRLDKRKQLILQLKGFLMIFEQILADHLSKLSHVKELFSFDPSIHHTFFPQVLNGIQDLEALFINFNTYRESQLRLIETEENFIVNRNSILDHVIARFSESMEKYAFFMKGYLGKSAGNKLIRDKISFLSDYIQVSTYRGKAFDYTTPEKAWNSDNVEGLKKRICRLLGIENFSRKKVAPVSIYIREMPIDSAGILRYVVVLADPDDDQVVLMESVKYESDGEARQILNYMLEEITDKSFYEEGKKDRWLFGLKRATQENDFEVVAESAIFGKSEEREAALKRTMEVLTSFSEDENFHLIEHILLRPKIEPREHLAKRKPAGVDADAVDLLTVRNVPETITYSEHKREEVKYRFNITQQKRNKKEDAIIWKLSLVEEDTEVLTVKEDFIFFRHLTRRIKHIREFGSDAANYHLDTKADGLYTFRLMGNNHCLAECRKGYRKKVDMEKDIAELVNFFSYERNFLNDQNEEDSLAYYADPYSQQVSFVLPSWHKRFRSPAFKHLFEKLIYLETPSHIHPHIYWLDHRQMSAFEEAYQLWIDELSDIDTPDTDIINKMILALNELRK